MKRIPSFAAAAIVLCAFASAVSAMDVTLRLVRGDAPDQLVSTGITQIDVEAELAKAKAEQQGLDASAAGIMGKGGQGATEQIVKPKSDFDQYSNYMRGIVIDGTIPFYKSYQGSYLGRSDVIHADLADGVHTVDPGGHQFTIQGGKITSDSPHLRINGATVDILAYPITIIAVDGSAVRDMPAEVRRLPVAPRLFWKDEELLPKEENLAGNATFKRLTLFMLANTQGAGYRISPSDQFFKVDEEGAHIVDAQGKPATDSGINVEGKYTIVLPQLAVPVSIKGLGVNLVISGPAGRLTLASNPKGETSGTLYAYAAEGGADIVVGHRASNRPMKFMGDLGVFPRRKIVIDATSKLTEEPRVLNVSIAGYSVDAGKTLRVRVQSLDALDAVTLEPSRMAAYLWRDPVLQDDGSLGALPETPDASKWQALSVQSTDRPDQYDLVIPADLPSSVYRLRIVVDRRDSCSPDSALQADFIEGVISPSARSTLSAFSPSGRHAFSIGAEMPLSVVVKSTVPVPAGKLKLSLRRDKDEYPLVERDLAELPAGAQPFHYVLAGTATTALAPGDYTLVATLGNITSNAWLIKIVDPQYKRLFPIVADARFSSFSIDQGVIYRNVPKDIAQANEGRRIFSRNAQFLSRLFDSAFSDWYITRFANYQGRDSASEIAEVEMVLRRNLSLPAHEVFYYQNHWEMANEALASYGLGHVNGVECSFSPNSLIHSVQSEVDADIRKHQLIAQLGQKFDNFEGMALLYPNSAPLGDPELGDENRTVRLLTLEKNFVDKNGFTPPTMGQASAFMEALLNGKATPELQEIGHRYEKWVANFNNLQGDFFGFTKEALAPIAPGMKLWNVGPGWGYSGGGTYPAMAQRNVSLMEVWTGFSDYAWPLIFEDFVRPKFFNMVGTETRAVISSTLNAGAFNNKNHFAANLAAGIRGWGHMGGPEIDPTPPTQIFHEEEFLEIKDIIHTYGPMFSQLHPTGDVAIFYPFSQTVYEDARIEHPAWMRNNSYWGTWDCITQLTLLGYNCEVLTEEMMDAGQLDRFSAVILPVQHYMRPQDQDRLEKFAAAGKPVLCGAISTQVPAGAKKIEDDFAELFEADVKWGLAYPRDIAHAWMIGEMLRKVDGLKKELEPHVKPFAQAKTSRVMVQTNRSGDGRYTYVWDFTFPSFMGTGRVTNIPDWSGYPGEANEQTLMPLKETISFPDNVYTYELFTQQPIDRSLAKDGRIETTADLSFTPFRIFVSLPQPIAKLRIEVVPSMSLGQHGPLKVTPLDPQGKPINASIPLQITLSDATGKQVSQSSAVSLNTFDGDLAVPLGFAPGQWKLTVAELVSGRTVETAVTVAAPTGLPFGASMAEVPQVQVQRGDLIASFVAQRKQDGQPVLVLLDESQYEPRLALAQEIVKQFEGLGVKAQIKKTSEPGVYEQAERVHLFRGWTEMNPGQYIKQHLVLLGGEGENVLIEEIQQSQLLVRPITASFPGPGKGVLALVRSPFSYNHDVICMLGPDEAGIRAAIAQLALVANATPDQPAGAPGAQPPAVAMTSNDLEGLLKSGTPYAQMDGAPVQTISVSAGNDRIAFGTIGYAKNVFLFDIAGNLLAEDKIGHVNTLDLQVLPDGKRMSIASDGTTYFRDADGALKWQFHSGNSEKDSVRLDPQGRYVCIAQNGTLAVCDLALKTLWQFDEFDKYETTREMLFGRKAELISIFDNGDTIAYRMSGKAPGLTGAFADDLIYADALTGAEKRRAPINMKAMAEAAGQSTEHLPPVKHWNFYQQGEYSVVTLQLRDGQTDILLDRDLKPIVAEDFNVPSYVGDLKIKTNRYLLADRRMVFTVGDTLCITDATWKTSSSVQMRELVLAMVVDEKAGRVAISDYSGRTTLFDLSLKEIWHADLGSAATLRLLPDGRVAAGTLRGHALLLGTDGAVVWTASLNRFAPPEDVEKRWAEIEAVPSRPGATSGPWWERVEQNVELSADLAGLQGDVKAAAPLASNFDAKPFGTYLVEWRHRRSAGNSMLSLKIDEVEKAQGTQPTATVGRVLLSSRPQDTEYVERALLRTGDRPDKINITIQASGEGQATSSVSVRQLMFPSEDHIRIASLYRNEISEAVRANPPVMIDMFLNVVEEGSPHDARWADPFLLVNGKMMEKEPGLINGKWFGAGTTTRTGSPFAAIPCFVEITLPRKQVVTHVVIAEDPNLARVESLTVDAFIESRETRKGLSDFEKAQMKRGFFQNVIKSRGNTNSYNVYKLEKPVFTNKLRVYVLSGLSSIDEIELYGDLPKELKKETTKAE